MDCTKNKFSTPIEVQIAGCDSPSRKALLKSTWRCHVAAYGKRRAWNWNHFVEKSEEYPLFFAVFRGGNVIGYAQTSAPKGKSRSVNLGSIGVQTPGKGIGRSLAKGLFDYCVAEDYALIAEILVEDLELFQSLFADFVSNLQIIETKNVVETLSDVRGKPMLNQLDFSKYEDCRYERYSVRRQSWETRLLLQIIPDTRKSKDRLAHQPDQPLVKWPPIDPALGRKVAEYFDAGKSISISGRDGVVLDLERWFEEYHQNRMALSFASGTTALQAAFFAAGLRPGDRVAATIYSYHATVSPLLQFGVRIDFIDVEAETGNISAEDLASKLTSDHKLLVTNHMWGHPVDVAKVKSCIDNQAPHCIWVEDCSHALFSEYKGQRVGTFGDMAVFSLQANKILPAGEGGILLTRTEEHHDRASCFGYSLARTKKCLLTETYRPLARTGFGLKHRIHPIGALIAQHHAENNLSRWIQGRKEAHSKLQEMLKDSPLFKPMTIRPDVTEMGAWYGYKPSLYPKVAPKDIVLAAANAWNLEITRPGSGRMDQLPLFRNPSFLQDTLKSSTNLETPSKFYGAERYLKDRLSFPTFHNGATDSSFLYFTNGLKALEKAFVSR